MNERLITTLQDLERIGYENDQKADKKSERMLNITHETGEFLAILINAANAKTILEIGTSNGYSTIWLADAARQTGGKVITVESDDCKSLLAKQNFAEADVEDIIEIYKGTGSDFLKEQKSSSYDFIFLDANREEYISWWVNLQDILKPGGLIVVDNAVSHLEELINFTSLVKITQGYHTSLVPIGKGELLIWKER